MLLEQVPVFLAQETAFEIVEPFDSAKQCCLCSGNSPGIIVAGSEVVVMSSTQILIAFAVREDMRDVLGSSRASVHPVLQPCEIIGSL